MRHLTWAVAWFIVGLTVTLGTASVLQQVVGNRQAAASPAIVPAPEPAPAPTIKPPAEGRDMVVASRRFYRERQ
jgi:hypothetical protein